MESESSQPLLASQPKCLLASHNMLTLKTVYDFQHVESYINNTIQDFKYRRAIAKNSFWKLKNIWKSVNETSLKVEFFKVSILSSLFYVIYN